MKSIYYLIIFLAFSCVDSNKTTLTKIDKPITEKIKTDTIPIVNKSSEDILTKVDTPVTKKAKTDTISIVNKSIILIDTIPIPVGINYPFGYDSLPNLKFPKKWLANKENYGRLKYPEGKEFENIDRYYQDINSLKKIKSPFFDSIKTFIYGTDKTNDYYFDKLAYKAIDSCKYRLPNIGIYECYYYVNRSEKGGTYGNLLLIDPKTKIGTILNIYFNYSGDQSVNMRYFFINHKIINIYEGYCYDDGCSLNEEFRISINGDGKIVLNEIK